MRAVVQRVREAHVEIEGQVVGRCAHGLLVLLGVAHGDGEEEARWMAQKLSGLRVFPDDQGRMDLALVDIGGEALVVSQFTLYGDCRKGRRPSFVGAAPPSLADPLYQRFCELLVAEGVPTQRGVFGADMQVHLVNDGPVTLVLDSP